MIGIERQTIAVIGLGYIGLPTAAVLASRGVQVIGVDVNRGTVETINAGDTHIVEPELDIIVRACVREGKLRATTVVEAADAFIIAVPTPFFESLEPDLSYIEAAARSIAPVLKSGDLIILESTCPVGATEKLSHWIEEARPDLTLPHAYGQTSDIRIAHCPERVLPGHVLRELVENDRIIGGITERCSQAAVDLYKIFVEGDCIVTDSRTAELCKLTENASRDVAIAFANELSVICDKLSIDVWELIKLANKHPRVNILQPGPGVGGHCIAVDPWFIVSSAPEHAHLIRSAREVNNAKPHWVVDRIVDAVLEVESRHGKGEVCVACLGLAFKANIDDLRESPSLDITLELGRRYGTRVLAVEPNIEVIPPVLSELGVRLVSLDTALQEANVIAILVDHREFLQLPLQITEKAVVVDTKGLMAFTRRRKDASSFSSS